jgi:hypothetical protein
MRCVCVCACICSSCMCQSGDVSTVMSACAACTLCGCRVHRLGEHTCVRAYSERRHAQQTSFVIGAKSEHLAQRTTPCACQAYRDPSYPLRNSIEDGTEARERSKHGSMATEGADADCRSAAKREGRAMAGRRGGGRGERRGRGGRGQEERGKGDGIGGRNPKVPDISCPAAGPITSGIIQCCKIISFFSHSKILKFLNPPFPSKK